MSAALLSRSSVSSFSRLILVCATALVVPGSHVWEKAERDKFFGTNLGHDSALVAQAVMPKGACLVYASSTLHAGGDNRSPATVRWGLRLSYNLAFLKQEENQFVSCPPDVARGLSDAEQALLGYGTNRCRPAPSRT